LEHVNAKIAKETCLLNILFYLYFYYVTSNIQQFLCHFLW